jgi:hypothetical protein
MAGSVILGLVDSPRTRMERERKRKESQWRAPERVVEGESGLAAGLQAPLPIDSSTSHFNARVAANRSNSAVIDKSTSAHSSIIMPLQQVHHHHHRPSIQLWMSLTASRQFTREHGHNGVEPCMLRSCGISSNTFSGSDPGSTELKEKQTPDEAQLWELFKTLC